jgi:murein DD-endopeptidase
MKAFQKTLFVASFLSIGTFYSKSFAQSHETSAPSLTFPVACELGKDCWAVNYVDTDLAVDKAIDYKCKSRTYDDHKGTDFAISSVTDMKAGVDVFAAADGKILRVRDSETDSLKSEAEIAEIKEKTKECGNGVLIDHGNGFHTMYCHLKQGSVVVKPDQKIKAGEKIAQVGLSGWTEFPHLHFGVLWEDGVIDPFTGLGAREGCGKMKKSLWEEELNIEYAKVGIFDGGFTSQTPDFSAIERGQENPKTIGLNSASFVFWAGFYNIEAGDEVTLSVTGPDGIQFVERLQTQEKYRVRQYYFTGRKIGKVQLQRGMYKGHVTIKREGTILTKRDFEVQVK